MSTGVGKPEVVAGQYRVLRALGSGAHGTVDLAEDLLNGGRRVALKRLEGIVGAGDPEPVADVLRWFLHPRWAEILDEGRLDAHGRFQVLRYVPGCGLDRVEVPRPPEEVFRFLEDGARVLRSLHRLGVIHYDVSPGNFVRDETPDGVTFTLTDGGLANLGPVRGIARGTPMYMAPEVIEGAPHDHRADLYGLGLVAYRLATGSDPFRGGAGEVLGRRRREDAPLARTVRPDVPEVLERILATLLQRDPARRPAHAGEVLDLLVRIGREGADRLGLDEATAIAATGPLVGRTGVVERFRSACRGISSASPARTPGEEFFLTEAPSDLPDLVLVLHGPEGVGCTRVMRELAAVARTEDLAVLALSGRAGAADRRSPIRRLSESLSLLAPDGDPYLVAASQHRGDALGADTVDAVDARAMERFVELCERVAGQRPVVVLVEDFAELPRSSQEALRVLSRHLQTRAEHPDGRRLPRLLLVLDHGADDPQDLLIPDARDPRRPCLPVAPFDESEAEAFLASRLDPRRALRTGDVGEDAAYRPLPGDVATLLRATEGLPRLLAAAMAEALVRGDLHSELEHWVWDTGPVSGYELRRTLPLAAVRAMQAVPPAVRDAAVSLALFDGAITAGLLTAIAGQDAVAALLRTPLAIVSQEGADVRIAPASRAIREALRSRPPDEIARLRRRVLEELGLRGGSELAADHARLLLDEGRAQEAFVRLTREEAPLRGVTGRSLRVLARILAADPALLATPAARNATARRLTTVAEAGPVADALFAAMPERLTADDLEGASLLAANDYAARRHERVVSLAARAADLDVTGPGARLLAHLRVNHARAVLAQRPDAAAPLLRAAALSLRRLGRSERANALELRAEYELASARHALVRGRTARSLARHRRALVTSRRARSATLVAQTLTNLAVALQQIGAVDEAERVTSRAVRIKLALGDIGGAVGSLHNLARLRRLQGAALDAAALHSRAVALGTRSANHHGVTLSLVLLAEIYDSQRNPRLAIGALLRCQETARAAGLKQHGLDALRNAAVLLGLMGLTSRARALMSQSAAEARRVRAGRQRTGHFEARAVAAFLDGNSALARHYLAFCADGTTQEALRLSLVAQAALPPRHELTASGMHTFSREVPAFRAGIARILRLSMRGHGKSANSLAQPAPSIEHFASYDLSGTHQRLLAEVLLAACQSRNLSGEQALSLLGAIARLASEQGFRLLSSRAGALRCLVLLGQGQLSAASLALSSALADLQATADGEEAPPAWVNALRSAPREFKLVLETLHPPSLPGRGQHQSANIWTELHAAAHALVLKSGAVLLPDTRIQRALRTILTISARLKTNEGLEALLESLTRFAREITKAERACIVLLSASGAREVHVATEALPAESGVSRSGISHTVIQRVMASRTPLLLHDVYGDSELMERPSIASLSLRSIMCVPMMRGEQLYGAMYADSSAGAGSFDRVDMEILSLLAEQAAAALETSRLLVDVQRSYGELKSAQERLIRGERLRVMGEMTSGVAHEFNNLLTAILARIQLLSLEYLAPGVRDSLQLIEKAALDAASVVRRLQAFTRTQRQADFQLVDLGEVCADAVEFLRPLWATRKQAGKRGIVVRLRSSGGLTVRGDATELREVVTNLLKNALEALEHGGCIAVTVERRAGRVRVEVADDGPGIPPELQQKLFTPFFTTKGERGTGLGLCLSQQIVERHGGEVRLTSTPGAGTKAVFEIPEAQPTRATQDPREAFAEGAPKQLAVLAVDDDPNVLGPLCTYLERSGFTVKAARSASECLAAASSSLPDVVISDIAMPGMDGLEMCRRLRRKYPQLPVVLMTGQTSDIDPEQARHSGASALLPKPFTMRQVLELLALVTRSPRSS